MAAKPANKVNCEADLISIYRLEFYKKKKNWKLSHDQPKTKTTARQKPANLNKTYNIVEPDPVIQEVSAHNEAFVETGSGEHLIQTEPEQLALYGSQPDWCEETHPEPGYWQVQQLAWCQSPQYAVSADEGCSPGWPSAARGCGQPDCVDGRQPAPPTGVDQCLQESWFDPLHWASRPESPLSASLVEFMVGAHAAPHSSEADLRPREAELVAGAFRDIQSMTLECPPSVPHDFLAGSFRRGAEAEGECVAGRGRGRRPLIRIGMGRPYRL